MLVGMSVGATTLENCLALSLKADRVYVFSITQQKNKEN